MLVCAFTDWECISVWTRVYVRLHAVTHAHTHACNLYAFYALDCSSRNLCMHARLYYCVYIHTNEGCIHTHTHICTHTVKTSAAPRVNIDWGTVRSSEKQTNPKPNLTTDTPSAEYDTCESRAESTAPCPPPPSAVTAAPSNYASSSSVAAVGGGRGHSVSASAGASGASGKDGSGKDGRGLLGWMSTSSKETASAKQLVCACVLYVEMRIRVYVCMYVCHTYTLYTANMDVTHTHTHIYKHMYPRICMHICVYMCV